MRAGSGVRARKRSSQTSSRTARKGAVVAESNMGEPQRKSCCRANSSGTEFTNVKNIEKLERHYCTLTWSQMEVAAGRLPPFAEIQPGHGGQ